MQNPDNPFAIALERLHAGEFKAAQVLCEEILVRDPIHEGAWQLSGRLLRMQGRHQDAIQVFEDILKRSPNAVEALLELALAYLETKQYDKALETSKRIVGLDSSIARGHLYLGCAQHSLLSLEESAQSFENVLRLEPNHFEATVNLGNVYHTLGRFSDAVTCYQRAIEWKPDRAVTFFNLAGSLRQVNRLDEA